MNLSVILILMKIIIPCFANIVSDGTWMGALSFHPHWPAWGWARSTVSISVLDEQTDSVPKTLRGNLSDLYIILSTGSINMYVMVKIPSIYQIFFNH